MGHNRMKLSCGRIWKSGSARTSRRFLEMNTLPKILRYSSLGIALAASGVVYGCSSTSKEVEYLPERARVVQVAPPVVEVPARVVVASPPVVDVPAPVVVA